MVVTEMSNISTTSSSAFQKEKWDFSSPESVLVLTLDVYSLGTQMGAPIQYNTIQKLAYGHRLYKKGKIEFDANERNANDHGR